MFIPALFTITKTWKQLKCPSSNKRIKTQFIYTVEYYSAIKRKKSVSFAATWMDLQIIILSEVSQRKTNIIWYHLYVESKKMIQMNLFTKQKHTFRHRKQTYGYWRGKDGRRDKLGIWDSQIHTSVYTIVPYHLSILYTLVCICESQIPNLSLLPSFPLQ